MTKLNRIVKLAILAAGITAFAGLIFGAAEIAMIFRGRNLSSYF